MDDANVRIKSSAFIFFVTGFINGSSLQLSFLTGQAGHDIWLVLLAGFMISIPLFLCFCALAKMFPDLNLNQMLECVYGRFWGTILSVFYFLNFLLILSLNLFSIAGFYTGFIMTDMPLPVFIVVFTLLCAYAVKKGMGTVAKVSFLVFAISAVTAITATILSIGNMRLSYFLPIFEIKLDDFAKTTSNAAAVTFGGVALLFITPHVKDKKKLARSMVGGLTISAVIFLLILFRNVSTLGPSSVIYSMANYQSVRMINIGDFITRIELIVVLANTSTLFIRISGIYYAAAISITQILKLKSYKTLLLPIGGIAVVIAIISFPSTILHANWGEKYATIYSVPFNIFFPVLTFIVVKTKQVFASKKRA